MTHKVSFLRDMALACSLGMDIPEVSGALFSRVALKNDLLRRDFRRLHSGRSTYVHPLPEDLPSLEDSSLMGYNSRTNRLVKGLLDRLKPSVEKIIQSNKKARVGCIIGNSTHGMAEAQQAYTFYKNHGKWPQTYDYKQQEPGSTAMFAKAYLDLKGPVYAVATACSAGAKAIVSGHRLLKAGLCEAVIVGGVDTLCPLTENGFDALGLISPEGSRPMSFYRNGITLGEGGALFLMVLGEEGSERGIILKGFGESSDGYHATAPHPEGLGARLSMEKALSASGLKPGDLTYVNLHGTGTLLNDEVESKVMDCVFKGRVLCSSSKGLIGHTLAASGALGVAVLWMFLKQGLQGDNILPYHHWDGVPDPQLPLLPLVRPGMGAGDFKKPVSCMANSFAFGGSNISIILQSHLKESK